MFVKKAKKEAVINNLILNNTASLKEKNQAKLKRLGLVVKYKLLDDYCDFIKNQFNHFSEEFSKVAYINVTKVEFANNDEFKQIYEDFMEFLKTEEEFYDFLENTLVVSLRTKYGFNPLEDDELLTMAIQFEHGKDINIKELQLSPD